MSDLPNLLLPSKCCESCTILLLFNQNHLILTLPNIIHFSNCQTDLVAFHCFVRSDIVSLFSSRSVSCRQCDSGTTAKPRREIGVKRKSKLSWLIVCMQFNIENSNGHFPSQVAVGHVSCCEVITPQNRGKRNEQFHAGI